VLLDPFVDFLEDAVSGPEPKNERRRQSPMENRVAESDRSEPAEISAQALLGVLRGLMEEAPSRRL